MELTGGVILECTVDGMVGGIVDGSIDESVLLLCLGVMA